MEQGRLEIEYAVIGSLIAAGTEAGQHISGLSSELFSDGVCRSMLKAVRELFFKGAPIDRLTLLNELGGEYEAALDEANKRRVSDLPYYIEMLKRLAKLTEARECGLSIAYAESIDAVTPALDRLNGLMVKQRGRGAVTLQEALHRFFDRHSGAAPEYLKWGFAELDEMLFCEMGDFVVVGGYPSAGKTLLAAQFALMLAKRYRVGFFSLETSADKLTDRLMSHKTQIPMQRIKTNQLNEADWKACYRAVKELEGLVLDEIPAAGMTAADIQAYSLAHRYEVIFIDYLQLVKGDGSWGRVNEVSEVSMALHTMAQSCGITVIALAQLSRPDKTQKNPPPPNMSSLRESGQIEQDADIIMLLYQEDMNDYRGRRVLKIGKNKEGERGRMLLDFNGDTQTLSPARPTRAESYAAVQKACAQARREHAAKKAQVPGQQGFSELPGDYGGDLPF